MKRYRLKKWVKSSIYFMTIALIVVSFGFIGKLVNNREENKVMFEEYVDEDVLMDDDTTNVVEITNETVNHPYLKENVNIAKDFYDSKKEEKDQINSLIYYKNTYMENTGVLYNSAENFDVVSVLDGTVTSITDDNILGKVVEVTHSNDLITIYQCLGEINVKVGDHLKQNDVIGKSGKVNIDKGYENSLLFEVNYKGTIINPNEFYNMKISDLIK